MPQVPGNTTFEGFLQNIGSPGANRAQPGVKLDQLFGETAGGAFGTSPRGFSLANQQGLASLNALLAGQGQTDPQLLNQQLAGISAGTQGAQQDLQGQLARLGIQNSGVGQAIGGAIGQGGINARSQAVAQDNFLAEQRKRQDLQLFNQLVQQPALNAAGLATGQGQFNQQQQNQNQAAQAQFAAQIMQMFAGS